MVVQGMYGLGDNVYQRSILREIKEPVYLRTSWPQLYCDLPNIRPVKPVTRLRTQSKNIAKVPNDVWHKEPRESIIRISYGSKSLVGGGTILKAMAQRFAIRPSVFDMPRFRGPKIDKEYAIVRPTTIRSEWYNRARGPKPEYVCTASQMLRDMRYYVISIADIDGKNEWCDNIPEHDLAFNRGELNFEELMGLIQSASLVVGGVGWIVPACVAAGVSLITILGGLGKHNAPSKIIDKPMNVDKTRFIQPDNFCMCRDNRHDCDKNITDFEKKFLKAESELNGQTNG